MLAGDHSLSDICFQSANTSLCQGRISWIPLYWPNESAAAVLVCRKVMNMEISFFSWLILPGSEVLPIYERKQPCLVHMCVYKPVDVCLFICIYYILKYIFCFNYIPDAMNRPIFGSIGMCYWRISLWWSIKGRILLILRAPTALEAALLECHLHYCVSSHSWVREQEPSSIIILFFH